MKLFDWPLILLATYVCYCSHRISELEAELEKSKSELLSVNKQLAEAHQVAMFQATVNTPRPGIVGTVLHKPVPQPPSE